RVVIGTVDPNERVCGRGISRMREAGIEVVVGVLEEQCQQINRPFFISHTLSRPYILLKWAQTSDGYLDVVRDEGTSTKWFTGWLNKLLVHRERSHFDAIAVGTNTVVMDDPELTTREYFGKSPVRITFDRRLRLPVSSRIFNDRAATLLFTSFENQSAAQQKFCCHTQVSIFAIDFTQPVPPQVVEVLAQQKIQSLIIEGGEKLLQSFIDHRLYDNILVFKSDRTLSQIHQREGACGIKAPVVVECGKVAERKRVLDCTVELR
ncbi:MAG: dihydrofolate reductase family protein, partial [Rikenellaceae bacterium]